MSTFPSTLPQNGLGEDAAFSLVAELVSATSAKLGEPSALAHMDPAPASVAARLVGLNAGFNQNLLHPSLSPFATEAERLALRWLSPFFGMKAGHMCAGSTIANLAALWCAREHGAERVIASADAHISIPKSARILGLPFESVPVDEWGRMRADSWPSVRNAALVLTAGTTGRGVVDDLAIGRERHSNGAPIWIHVDAAWAGPLRLTRHADRLDGVEHADSVAISAHKWLFQPKDSAIVLFAEPRAQDAISFGGSYLATPNVGVQGSRGAAGVALLGTLLAWGREGVAKHIEGGVALADLLADRLSADPRAELKQRPETGVINWRPRDRDLEETQLALGNTASSTTIDRQGWLRHVAANMHANIEAVWEKIDAAL